MYISTNDITDSERLKLGNQELYLSKTVCIDNWHQQ